MNIGRKLVDVYSALQWRKRDTLLEWLAHCLKILRQIVSSVLWLRSIGKDNCWFLFKFTASLFWTYCSVFKLLHLWSHIVLEVYFGKKFSNSAACSVLSSLTELWVALWVFCRLGLALTRRGRLFVFGNPSRFKAIWLRVLNFIQHNSKI